jgi:hypothetical protein
MSIFCFGLSHQTAAMDVRERFAIPESAQPEALARLKTMPGLTEGIIVSTCNRTEFYVTGELRDSSAPAFFESFYRGFRAGDETHFELQEGDAHSTARSMPEGGSRSTSAGRMAFPRRNWPSHCFKCRHAPTECSPMRNNAPPPVAFQTLENTEFEPE